MRLKCPYCENLVEVKELKRQPGSGGGCECPSCKEMVRLAQPHAIFRRSVSLLLSCLALIVFGVKNPFGLFIGSILLWIPVSLAYNSFCYFVMPTQLKPWKPRGRKPFDASPLELFNNRPKSGPGHGDPRR